MFTVEDNWIIYINLIAAAILLLSLIHGWRKGFLRMIIALAGTIAAAYGAWVFSPVTAKYFMIMPKDWAPMQDTVFAQPIYLFCNRLIWFLILLLVIKLLFKLLDKVLIGIQKIPLIKQIAEIGGAALGLAEGFIWTIVMAVVLSTPLFTNGAAAVQKSCLATIQQGGTAVLSSLIEPVIESESISQIISGNSEMTKAQQDLLEKYLQENGYTAAESSTNE